MSVLSEIINAKGRCPVPGPEWALPWFVATAIKNWHYSFKNICWVPIVSQRQDSYSACPQETYSLKKNKWLFLNTLFVPGLRLQLPLIRECMESITARVCHYVVPFCVIEAILHMVMVSSFQQHCLWLFCVYFSHPSSQTFVNKNQSHLHTCSRSMLILPAFVLLWASVFNLRAQIRPKYPSDQGTFLFSWQSW